MRKAVRLALYAALVALNAGNSLAARQVAAEQVQQAPTFRAGTHLIEIDVRVTDRDGRFVNGLSREDFDLLEDGEPKRIDLFSFVNIPTRSDQIEQLGAGASSAKADRDGAATGRDASPRESRSRGRCSLRALRRG